MRAQPRAGDDHAYDRCAGGSGEGGGIGCVCVFMYVCVREGGSREGTCVPPALSLPPPSRVFVFGGAETRLIARLLHVIAALQE